ncbi:nucleotidyl transferase AbiEii/AbiGii toxin family protein [Herbivorax sp. ANBcel31]|uniref:nucleotidyl transferase AbiEii/AbiGii toxin family protein n=1 Tax=Herbivorax sp. ANBcel31 TaxID=3069754 RepID=UPI0027ADAF74|nr:nucleotidyl transferase AbiEii/AbiGii toxin family protein [Herbivorax sp. ANBcel31]MDQ2086067.1 nucleotidyl transferase AbiEii/AbiGii toxin family protein [Herbivorax sp. ANBcel31]
MIAKKNFTKEWIQDRARTIKKGKKQACPELIEKVINALYLLENLVNSKLKFIFKGGTSLLLLLNKTHRFSIDIDIIIEKQMNSNELKILFNKIIKNSMIFYKYEEIKRNNFKNIPKAHYKFYYKSALDGTEKYVLLDILFQENPYIELVEKNIDCTFLEVEEESNAVIMPSIDCILGDKLTAFAPNTTGILYENNKELEIIKQLFDISNLFDEINNLKVVRETFINVSKREIEYRKLKDMTFDNVLDDIIATSIVIAFRGSIQKEKYKQLEEGIKRIKSYIFSRNYIVEDAVLSAGKSAYVSLLLKNPNLNLEYYDPKIDINKLSISNQQFHRSFKSIKKFSPEGFYYWYKALELYERIMSQEVATTMEIK